MSRNITPLVIGLSLVKYQAYRPPNNLSNQEQAGKLWFCHPSHMYRDKQHIKIVTNGNLDHLRSYPANFHWFDWALGSVNATRRQLYTHIYNAGTQYSELVYNLHTSNVHCTYLNWMHEIRAKKRVKFANIKMSHPKSQNEPRWLMSHRLGTPDLYLSCNNFPCNL